MALHSLLHPLERQSIHHAFISVLTTSEFPRKSHQKKSLINIKRKISSFKTLEIFGILLNTYLKTELIQRHAVFG